MEDWRREGRRPQRPGAGALQEGPRARVARVRRRQHGGLAARGNIRLGSSGETTGHRLIAGRRTASPSRASWRQSQRRGAPLRMAEIHAPAPACRPRPAARRSLVAVRAGGGGARWDRPQRGSRIRRLGAPGPDARRSECGGCRRAPRHRPASPWRWDQGEAAESGDGARPLLGLGVAQRPFRRLREEVSKVGGIRRQQRRVLPRRVRLPCRQRPRVLAARSGFMYGGPCRHWRATAAEVAVQRLARGRRPAASAIVRSAVGSSRLQRGGVPARRAAMRSSRASRRLVPSSQNSLRSCGQT